MKTYLMCKPKYFEVRYDINPWMTNNIGKVDYNLAQSQWQLLYDIIIERANIKLIEPVHGLPDMVFTANAGIVAYNQIIISTFRHQQRVKESIYFNKFFTDNWYEVKKIDPSIIFEGAGDALFDEHGELWLGCGQRSDPSSVIAIANSLDLRVNILELIDPNWYHLDTVFCPLDGGLILAYDKAFSPESINLINARFNSNVIWISDDDAQSFVCNAVSIGNEVILNKASNELRLILKDHGYETIEVPMSEFMKSGGSCKCLTLKIQ